MRTRSRLGFCWLGFLLVAAPASAQTGAIEGVVRDADTGVPVAAARVSAMTSAGARAASSTADAGGAFRIGGLEPGPYAVRVDALGYATTDREGVLVEGGAVVEVAIELPRRAFDLDPVVVSVSRFEEKRIESPAAVEVVDPMDLAERPAVTLADHVVGVAGTDVIRTGLQGNYVTIRGFNNVFSGATLTLTDNRIASVPSLRANVLHMNPTTDEDIERVEVVLGPGSALYGPNAANGVIHAITSSPIDAPGGSLSFASGVRQQAAESVSVPGLGSVAQIPSSSEPALHAQGRYAHRWGTRLGVKLSGQYFAGEEWRFVDPAEAEQQAEAVTCRAAGYATNVPACLNFAEGLDFTRPGDVEVLRTSVDNVAGGRDEEIRRFSLDLRADWRPEDDLSLILSSGWSRNQNSIDLTGLGAAQVVDWDAYYVQGRALYRDAFAQVFMNRSGNTRSYLLRSGRPLLDRSSVLVAQLQNESLVGDRHRLVYGLDAIRTVPRTEGTINGQNEEDDEIDELGGYLQTESSLNPVLDLVLAGRLDTHSRLEDPVLSPRAALVYRPGEGHNLRFTYNRAFSTPTTLNLFLDISGGTVPLGGPFRYDVRAQGATETGMRFSRTDGVPDFMSPFGLLLGTGPRQFRPTTTENLWEVAVAVVGASNEEAGDLLAGLPPPTGEDIAIDLRVVNLDAGPEESPFAPATQGLGELTDIEPLRPTITNTFEVGYKGLLGDRLLLAANGYHTRIDDFTSALRVNSPNVFLDRGDVQAYLEGFGVPEGEAAALAESIGGEGEHGSREAPGIPLGVITPEEAGGTDAAIVLTYENLGSVDLWGADASATLLLGAGWEVSANAAWVSDDRFDAGAELVPLNAPTLKGAASVRYREPSGLHGQFRARHVGSFPANSAVYVGEVEAYTVFDLNLGYRLERLPGVSVQLDVQDLFDSGYRTFVGTPRLGRFALLRLRWAF